MPDAINVVWFKRDLRLQDHQPIARAIQSGLPCVLLYLFEPEQLSDGHYAEQHWRFVTESLTDINHSLHHLSARVSVAHCDAVEAFTELNNVYSIANIFSHQETGLAFTFARDQGVARFCRENNISWSESVKDAVVRGARDRLHWDGIWRERMREPLIESDLRNLDVLLHPFDTSALDNNWAVDDPQRQSGGSSHAWGVLHSFLEDRGQRYQTYISKPLQSQLHCSRLSPYLAWGNISLRQAYQTALKHRDRPGWKRALTAFSSRLHWHCHFVQKFESESAMEKRANNRAYANLPYRNDENVASDLAAWKSGNTGFPLVDACMRCLLNTGYLNFRMRAMLVSFLCHHLQIDWRLGVKHLASVFLDFEPGIHYPQFQMQAGVTGINIIRIYNPTKQAQEHDTDGEFIRRWCQELKELPIEQLFEPWRLTRMEQQMYSTAIGDDYPEPIIDLKQTYKIAQKQLWSWRKRADVKQEAQRILTRHVRPS